MVENHFTIQYTGFKIRFKQFMDVRGESSFKLVRPKATRILITTETDTQELITCKIITIGFNIHVTRLDNNGSCLYRGQGLLLGPFYSVTNLIIFNSLV